MANIASSESLLVRVVPGWVTPNILSWIRIIAVPLIWVVYLLGPIVAFLVFFFACVTDLLDGRVARERGLITVAGKRLDEVADKLLVVGVLLVLFADDVIPFSFESPLFWVVVLIVTRDLAVSAMRSMWSSRASRVPSLMLAKVKTTTLMLSLGFFLYSGGEYPWREYSFEVGHFFLWVAFICAKISWIQYVVLFMRHK